MSIAQTLIGPQSLLGDLGLNGVRVGGDEALLEAVGIDTKQPEPPKTYVPAPQDKKLADELENMLRLSQDRRREFVADYRKTRARVAGPYHADARAAIVEEDRQTLPASDAVNMERRLWADICARLFPLERKIACTPKLSSVQDMDAKMRAAILQHYYDEACVSMQLRLAGSDATMCGEGVVIVAPIDHNFVELSSGIGYDPGELVVARIDPSDYDHDPDSDSPEKDRWRCVRFHVPKAHLRRDKAIDPNIINALNSKKRFGTLDKNGHEDDPNQSQNVGEQEFVELRRWFFYGGNQTLTCTTSPGFQGLVRPLEEYPIAEGPIVVLSLQPIGGSHTGLSPLADVRDISSATNQLVAKMINQALRAKTVEVGDVDDKEDNDIINSTTDGERVSTANPDSYRLEKIDPLIPSLLPAVEFLQNQGQQNTAQSARNVGDQGIAKTAKEAMILREQGMVRYGDLAAQVKDFNKRVLYVMAFFVDAIIRQQVEQSVFVEYQVPVGSQKVPMITLQRDAEHTRERFEFDTIDDAMAYADPAMRLEQLLATMTNVAAAIAPYMQLGLDPTPIIKRVARESGFAEFEEMIGQNSMAMVNQAAQGIVQSTYQQQGARVSPQGMQQQAAPTGPQNPMAMAPQGAAPGIRAPV